MDSTFSNGLNDDMVAIAAKRIIQQHRLQQNDRSEDSLRSVVKKSLPDDSQSMRLALDEMTLAIEHLQRLMVSREAVFVAALERIERNLAKFDGRIDALAEELNELQNKPLLDTQSLLDEQRVTITAVMQEFGSMMELGRTLLDEAEQIRSEATLTATLTPDDVIASNLRAV